MNVTGVVLVDLSGLVEHGGWVDYLSPEARLIWCQLEQPTSHVRIDVGEATSVTWPKHFLDVLARCESVQVVGRYPWALGPVVAALQECLDRRKAAA